MKKFILLLSVLAIVSCSKNDSIDVASSSGTKPQWTGLYCICHYKIRPNGSYDTIFKECGNDDKIHYYAYTLYPGSDSHYARRIYNCNECK